MSDPQDVKLFENYSLEQLFKQVVLNSRQNRHDIKQSIKLVTDLVQNITDVQILSPQIANYLGLMVKNDQLLINLSKTATKLMDQKLTVVQGSQGGLSQQQRKHLIQQANKQIEPILKQSRRFKTQQVAEAKKIVGG